MEKVTNREKDSINLQTHEELSKRAIALQDLILQIKDLIDDYLEKHYPERFRSGDAKTK